MDFGKERMYGAVWWGVGSLVAGIGIDYCGFDFLYVCAVVSALATYFATVLYCWSLNRDTTGAFSKPEYLTREVVTGIVNRGPTELSGLSGKEILDLMQQNRNKYYTSENFGRSKEENITTRKLFMMLCRSCYGSALILFIFAFAIGMAVIDNLAFIFFEFLGSSNAMNGWTVVFTVIFELPLFYLAPYLLQCYGPGKLLILAGLAYVIRVVGYTLVPMGHMWIVLLLETLHGISYACSKTGSVEYVARIMPKGYEASGQVRLKISLIHFASFVHTCL